MRTELLEVAKDAGFYGETIRQVLRDHRIVSYTDLASRLTEAGVRHERTGSVLSKGAVANWAVDRVQTPNWFMRQIGIVLKQDPKWWDAQLEANPKLSAPKAPQLKLKIDLAEGYGMPESLSPTVEVPWIAASVQVNAAVVPNELARPYFRRGDLTILDVTTQRIDEGCVYAVREEAGNTYRKAVYDEEAGDVVLRASGRRRADIPALEADVAGKVIVHFERFRPESSPRGRFDFSGELFGEPW